MKTSTEKSPRRYKNNTHALRKTWEIQKSLRMEETAHSLTRKGNRAVFVLLYFLFLHMLKKYNDDYSADTKLHSLI